MNSIDVKAIREDLFDEIIRFMKENDIQCREDILQSERIELKAQDFIIDLFDITEPFLKEQTKVKAKNIDNRRRIVRFVVERRL